MEELEFDMIIIGSGPAGQKAAIQGSKEGKKVVVVERALDPGGNCLFSGTIPSKTLREAVIDLTRFHERHFFDGDLPRQEIGIDQLNSRLQKVLEDQKSMIYRQFRRNNIRLMQGTARFKDSHTIEVLDEEYKMLYELKAPRIVIATGSVPRNPMDVPFDDEVILDSTRLLGLKKIPKTMIVLGGGIIGAEYASFFAALGTEVTIVDKGDHVLPLLDDEIGVHLQTALTDIGLKFLGKKRPIYIHRQKEHAYVQLDDDTTIHADTLLYALGRSANVENLQIENAGLSLSERGYLKVNTLFQTEVSHIYAVGDVIGGASLASTSMEQGRLASRHACDIQTHHFPSFYPIGIYTIPEISSIGYTEKQLKEKGFNYEVGRAYYYEIARSHIAGTSSGMIKLLFHKDTLEILGVHAIGRGATEYIHIGQMAISFNAKIDYFVDQIFNYPTYAEGYRVAALNGINKIKHRRK